MSAALAQRAALSSILEAVREREARRAAIAEDLTSLQSDATATVAQIDDLLPEARRRLED